ncbi:MAG TPA: glycosyltransferase family 9 protein [Candidatus Kapabacteria bacterium]|nr:glycosyltransferase family 9 protein [Candidatus Kapabacteria bacterium]
MSDKDQLRQQFFHKRRKGHHGFFVTPKWYRRVGVKIEEYNKKLTIGGLGKMLRIKPAKHPIPLSEIRSVLILRYDAIGDMVVTTQVWRILKRIAPHIKIGVACSYRNIDVLRVDPDVDVVYDMSEADVKQILRGAREARKENWQISMQTVYNRKTKGAIISRLACPKGLTSIAAHDKLAHYQKLFSIVGHAPHQGKYLMPMIDVIKAHFEAVFDYKPTQDEWHPSLVIDEKVLTRTRERIAQLHAENGTRRFFMVNTEAWTPFKEWGYENTLELVKLMQDKYPDCLFLITSSPATQKAVEHFIARPDKPSRMIYYATADLHELMAITRYSDMVITPDTSIVHMATAERKPIVAMFVWRSEWLPYNVPNVVLTPQEGNPVSTIPLSDVFAAVEELMPA